MFVLFAALISSFGFAQGPARVIAAGFSGCAEKTKTFTITDEKSPFKKITFFTDDKGQKLLRIDTHSQPLIVNCGGFDRDDARKQKWSVEAQDLSPTLAEALVEFASPSKEMPDKVAYTLTDKNDGILHEKIDIRVFGRLELHSDAWPDENSLHLYCGFDSTKFFSRLLEVHNSRLIATDKADIAVHYETIKGDEPTAKGEPGNGKPCPSEDYILNVTKGTLYKVDAAPTAKKAKSSSKTSGTH